MASRLTLRIQERFADLTRSEQKLAALILNRQDDALTHSATELAGMAGVSKATAARFFRTLGYADFNEVRAQAREERNRTQPYRYSVAGSQQIALGKAIGAQLDLELSSLTRTFEELRSDNLKDAAEIIAEAPRMFFLGFGLEQGFAGYARLLFARLRHGTMVLGAANGTWAEDLAMTGPRDALLLLTLDPRPRMLRSILNYATTTRVSVITVTDHTYLARAGRFSRVVLPVHAASFGLGPSHTAMSATIRLLALAYAAHVGDSVSQHADAVADIHDEIDDVE